VAAFFACFTRRCNVSLHPTYRAGGESRAALFDKKASGPGLSSYFL
jgi:hypothetical protein